ncbi:MAG: hypothetical protein JNL71_17025 [Rhodospirillales bacterium]|nr:hypothetical protein [Rhodospirillales bacterium]
MSMSAKPAPVAARYGADQVVAALDHHARLNRHPVTVISVEFSEDAARAWIVTLAGETGVATQRWIEDPRPVDTVKADIFHAGVRLGLLG